MQTVTVHAVAEQEKASRRAFQRVEVRFQRKPGQFEITAGLPGFEAHHVEVTAAGSSRTAPMLNEAARTALGW